MYLLIINDKPIRCKLRFVNRISTIVKYAFDTFVQRNKRERKRTKLYVSNKCSKTIFGAIKYHPPRRSSNNIVRIFFILITR